MAMPHILTALLTTISPHSDSFLFFMKEFHKNHEFIFVAGSAFVVGPVVAAFVLFTNKVIRVARYKISSYLRDRNLIPAAKKGDLNALEKLIAIHGENALKYGTGYPAATKDNYNKLKKLSELLPSNLIIKERVIFLEESI